MKDSKIITAINICTRICQLIPVDISTFKKTSEMCILSIFVQNFEKSMVKLCPQVSVVLSIVPFIVPKRFKQLL
jgi:hypothetical protein